MNADLKIDFIVMAAGSSRRFGSNKLLYPIQGRPVYSRVLEQLELAVEKLSGISCRVFVVSRFEEILKAAEERGWQAVYSPESEAGVSWTIKNGISAACDRSDCHNDQSGSQSAGQSDGRSDYYMFLTSDQPCLQASSIVRLVQETLAAGKGIGSMCWQEQPGNPVIFHRKYLPELLALEGDTGGRKVVKKHPEDCFFCHAGQKEELADADRPEAMEIILDYIKKLDNTGKM